MDNIWLVITLIGLVTWTVIIREAFMAGRGTTPKKGCKKCTCNSNSNKGNR